MSSPSKSGSSPNIEAKVMEEMRQEIEKIERELNEKREVSGTPAETFKALNERLVITKRKWKGVFGQDFDRQGPKNDEKEEEEPINLWEQPQVAEIAWQLCNNTRKIWKGEEDGDAHLMETARCKSETLAQDLLTFGVQWKDDYAKPGGFKPWVTKRGSRRSKKMTKGQDGATKMKDVPMKANTIFFNNAKTLSEDDLRGAFPQGSIQEIRIMGTGNHGFIRFTESELARKTIQNRSLEMKGRKVHFKEWISGKAGKRKNKFGDTGKDKKEKRQHKPLYSNQPDRNHATQQHQLTQVTNNITVHGSYYETFQGSNKAPRGSFRGGYRGKSSRGSGYERGGGARGRGNGRGRGGGGTRH